MHGHLFKTLILSIITITALSGSPAQAQFDGLLNRMKDGAERAIGRETEKAIEEGIRQGKDALMNKTDPESENEPKEPEPGQNQKSAPTEETAKSNKAATQDQPRKESQKAVQNTAKDPSKSDNKPRAEKSPQGALDRIVLTPEGGDLLDVTLYAYKGYPFLRYIGLTRYENYEGQDEDRWQTQLLLDLLRLNYTKKLFPSYDFGAEEAGHPVHEYVKYFAERFLDSDSFQTYLCGGYSKCEQKNWWRNRSPRWGSEYSKKENEFIQRRAYQQFMAEQADALFAFADEAPRKAYIVDGIGTYKYDFDHERFDLQLSAPQEFSTRLDFNIESEAGEVFKDKGPRGSKRKILVHLKKSPDEAEALVNATNDRLFYAIYQIEIYDTTVESARNARFVASTETDLKYRISSPIVELFTSTELTKKIGEINLLDYKE